ncbi:MAG TPA: hypothetical protein VKG80_03705 [Trebonia sp.]|nr:hypothetical protein [Trebonia sp.]
MELSSGQQRLLFVVVVLALAGLGIFLLGPSFHHKTTAAPTPSPSSAAASVPAISSSPAAQPATTPATPATTGGGVNIYQWLPFSQQDLTAATQATLSFAADYDTYSYTETDKAYIGKMAGVVTAELAATLKNAYDLPSAASMRSSQKQVAASSGQIVSIRSFGTGPSSIIFVVNITQKVSTTNGPTSTTQQYAVTAIAAGGGWQVNDIELAKAGNF